MIIFLLPYGDINSRKIFIEKKTEKNNEVCVDRSHGTYEYVLFRFMNREEIYIYFSCMIINIIQYEIQSNQENRRSHFQQINDFQ